MIENWQYESVTHPLELLSGMSIPEFDTWLKTDRYQNIRETYDMKEIANLLEVIIDYPELDKYINIIFNILKSNTNKDI